MVVRKCGHLSAPPGEGGVFSCLVVASQLGKCYKVKLGLESGKTVGCEVCRCVGVWMGCVCVCACVVYQFLWVGVVEQATCDLKQGEVVGGALQDTE